MEASFIESGRWIRGDEDIALRMRVGDPGASLRGGVAVDPGVVALLLEDRTVHERLAPGDYALEALLALSCWGSGKAIDLALVDAKPISLPFALREVHGKHGGTASLSFRVTVEIASVPKLVAVLLPAPGRVGQAELSTRLHADVRAAADAVVGRESLGPELDPARLGAVLESMLASVGAALGLRITHVDGVALDLDAPAVARLHGEVDLVEESAEPLKLAELERTPWGTGRDPARERELERQREEEGIPVEALVDGSGPAEHEGIPSRPSRPEPALEPGTKRCRSCGMLLRGPGGLCPECATPVR